MKTLWETVQGLTSAKHFLSHTENTKIKLCVLHHSAGGTALLVLPRPNFSVAIWCSIFRDF